MKSLNLLKQAALTLLRVYRFVFSLLLPLSCRFEPSCSQYAMTAIQCHGVTRGAWLTIKRLLRCHPWHPGGIDPVHK